MDLAAYRIIQESLTNAVRHAGPASATVSLAWGDGQLRVDVRDTGRGAAANGALPDVGVAGAGHGLVGMRERAAAVGGTLEAGPSRGGGFAVQRRAADRDRSVIRVLLADDQALVRGGFRMLLDSADDIEVVGEASDGERAVAMVD